jgi:hypothetical protein
MPGRRASASGVKIHRSYTIAELATCCGVHRNTVRHWMKNGLEPLDHSRPLLFHGATVRAFVGGQRASRKRSCPPGTLYCLRCREPRKPALGMVDLLPITEHSGNLRALCEVCETILHRRARRADLPRIMPDCTIQIVEE